MSYHKLWDSVYKRVAYPTIRVVDKCCGRADYGMRFNIAAWAGWATETQIREAVKGVLRRKGE